MLSKAMLPALAAGFLCAVVASGVPSRTAFAQGSKIFDNGNIYAVQNRPSRPTTFRVSGPTRITKIMTYHWNYERGARPGTIALRSRSGQTFGPWQATGLPGQGGVPDAYWIVELDVSIPPGSYRIVDSNPSTWAQNSGSGGAGIASVEGYPE